MKTVNEVSKIAGVSIRTLQYYDKICLLHPSAYSNAGYRLYDDTDLEKLQQIMLFRELEFPLKDIKSILERPDFDRNKAMEQQIELLTLKKEHIMDLIRLARGVKKKGEKYMDFKAFDTEKIKEYTAQAKAAWGKTSEYKEFEKKQEGRTTDQQNDINARLMHIFTEFGAVRNQDPASNEAQALVKKLQDFITVNFYTCSDEILSGLGKMYSAGGDFTVNIDQAGGAGTASFTDKAIGIYCRR